MPRRKIKKKSPSQAQVLEPTKPEIQTLKEMVDDAVNNTTIWEQKNQKWHKMRMRIKKSKTSPFKGCANLRMPTIETKLRKVKSALVNVIYGIRPVVQVIPDPSGTFQTALKIEKWLDHLIMDVIKLKPKTIVAIDQELEKGFYIMKPYWKLQINTRTEEFDLKELSLDQTLWLFDPARTPDEIRQAVIQRFDIDMKERVAKENNKALDMVIEQLLAGKSKIKADFLDVICDYPDVALCPPERVYVPTDSGFDPQSCAWLIHEFYLPLETVKTNGKYKGWNLEEIADIEYKETAAADKDIDTTKDVREGIEILQDTGKLKIWEYYGIWGNKTEPKISVLTAAPDFDKKLREVTLPFYSGKKPFVKIFYELTDDRWFSHRGIPELIEDIVKEIDIQHCQKIDQQTIRNTPMYLHRAGLVNERVQQFIFGQSIPVHGMQQLNDILQPLNNNNPNVEFSYEREQMILETKVEELIGQIDFTLQSMINKRQPRTLGEVQLQNQNMQQVFSLDAGLHINQFEELFNWIWELWCQYGEDQVEFAYFGKEGWEQIKLSKEEIQGKYKITIRGNDQNTNPQVRLQKAQMIMMDTYQALQMGLCDISNAINARKRVYQEMDIPNWEEIVIPQSLQKPAGGDIPVKFEDLEDGEKAQVLQGRGIQPDMGGRRLKSRATIQEKQGELKSSNIEDASKIAELIIEGRKERASGGGNGKPSSKR